MTLIDSDRVREAIEAEWTNECAHLRAPAACETCRAYDNAIRAVLEIHGTSRASEARSAAAAMSDDDLADALNWWNARQSEHYR